MAKSANQRFKQAGEALASSNPAVKKVTALCLEQDELENSIAEIEEMLKTAKARLNLIKVKDMPDAMSELGSMEWTSENGHYKVAVGTFVSGTLPKEADARAEATDYFASIGGGPLIKTEIALGFGKQEHALAEKAKKVLKKAGFDPVIQTGVHPQSLLAFVREKLEAGEEIDADKLGVFVGRQAKLTVVDVEKKAAAREARLAKKTATA